MLKSGDHQPPETLETSAMDPTIPLKNLSVLLNRMETLRQSLSSAIARNNDIPDDHIRLAASEISSAVHQIVFNAASLIASSSLLDQKSAGEVSDPIHGRSKPPDLKGSEPRTSRTAGRAADSVEPEGSRGGFGSGTTAEIVEIDAEELTADHVHMCEICGKGFKRDANLRMHMRAHGNQYKTLEALTKPGQQNQDFLPSQRRFSCPIQGCSKNKNHQKFRPLKTVACVKNHFKRIHCKKIYSCEKCNKGFSVLGDMRSHLKSCGEERKWRCSCGTSFSRKDKLAAHVELFEGHLPAVNEEGENDRRKKLDVEFFKEEEGENDPGKELDTEFFDGLSEEMGCFADWV